MCLTVAQRYASKKEAIEACKSPLIAKKDITVYKGLKKVNDTTGVSPHRRFEFKKGFHYYQDDDTFGFTVKPSLFEWVITIREGLHACQKKRRAVTHSQYVVKMIVPKGAKYFV